MYACAPSFTAFHRCTHACSPTRAHTRTAPSASVVRHLGSPRASFQLSPSPTISSSSSSSLHPASEPHPRAATQQGIDLLPTITASLWHTCTQAHHHAGTHSQTHTYTPTPLFTQSTLILTHQCAKALSLSLSASTLSNLCLHTKQLRGDWQAGGQKGNKYVPLRQHSFLTVLWCWARLLRSDG